MTDEEWNARMKSIDDTHAQIMRNYRWIIRTLVFLIVELVVFVTLAVLGIAFVGST